MTDSSKVGGIDRNLYQVIHNWVRKNKGYAESCVDCGVKGKYTITKNNSKRWNLDWANISGDYKRDLDDYKGLCRKCHATFDEVTNNYWVGKKFSPEHKQKIGEARRGKSRPSFYKPILSVSKDGVITKYDSQKTAIAILGFSKQSLNQALVGRRKTYRGLEWRYDV